MERGVFPPVRGDSGCQCETCFYERHEAKAREDNPLFFARMFLCEVCGNKRCPHATDHRNACTGSNEPGQPGSSYQKRVGSQMMETATRAQKLALVLLRQHVVPHKEQRTEGWTAIYELESLFGVDETSSWKSVADAVKHCALTTHPAPMARYEYTEHAIHVFNGDLLTRIVKLRQID